MRKKSTHDPMRRRHRDLVDDAAEAQHLEQQHEARRPRAIWYRVTRLMVPSTVRPMVFIDSSRSVFHRRLVTAPNSARSTIRLSRSRGQCVSTTSMMRARPRRHDGDPVGEHRRLVQRVGDQEHRGAESRATAAAPRRPSAAASAGRARRTARRAGSGAAASPACARCTRAGACRPKAAPDSSSRSRDSPTSFSDASRTRRSSSRPRRVRPCAGRTRRCSRRRARESDASSWNTTPMPSGRLARDRPPFELDPALGRGNQPGDQLEQRRLAAAGRPDDREELALADARDRSARARAAAPAARRWRESVLPTPSEPDVRRRHAGHGRCDHFGVLMSSGRNRVSMILL